MYFVFTIFALIKYHMKMKEQKIKKEASVQDVRGIFKKMLSDKNKMRSYIQEHGTLNGFKDDTIIFAKPL